MFDWLKKRFGKSHVPDLGVHPEPVQINPPPSARETRRLARIERLKQASAQGDERTELREELARLERRS